MDLLKDLMFPTTIPPVSIKNNTHPTDKWTLQEWAVYNTLMVVTGVRRFRAVDAVKGDFLVVDNHSACNRVYEYYINIGLIKNEMCGF